MTQLPQPRQFKIFGNAPFHIPLRTAVLALQDISFGNPHGELLNEPVDFYTKPLLLLHEQGSHELLNSLIINETLSHMHENQRVFCDIVHQAELKAGEEKLLRFLSREVVWCEFHNQDPYDKQKKSWLAVHDTLYYDEELERLVAQRLFGRNRLSMKNIVLLCRHRISEQTMCAHRKALGRRDTHK